MQVNSMRDLNSLVKFTVLLTLVYTTLTPRTMAGCGVNFDKMRKRRIEAIRGQILSKLGMTQLPNNEVPPPSAVPHDIENMYNRTRDFVLEQARMRRLECEEPEENYYAQEITTVYMKNARPAADEQPREFGIGATKGYKGNKLKRQLSEFFHFSLATHRIDPNSIVSASLRLYQVQIPGTPRNEFQQVEMFQLAPPTSDGTTPVKQFLHRRTMDTNGQGWTSFDVTSSVRQWVDYPITNQGLELTIPCSDEEGSSAHKLNSVGDAKKLDIIFAGSTSIQKLQDPPRGDQQGDDIDVPAYPAEYNPHLVIMARTPNTQSSTHSSSRRRHKRALDADYCFRRNPTETNCCLRELFIDFRKDLGWTWIQAPSGYKANFCAGACPYLWSTDTQHATILSLYKSMNPSASSAPCCTPKELEPLTIMYYDNGNFKFTQMSDMMLVSCKCS